jgi:cell division septal protein FtsQ
MKKNLFIKHTWKYLLLVIVGMFFSLQVLAQSLVVKGSVVDKNGEAIIGANILVKGTTNGSITDFDGNFTLDANKGLSSTYKCNFLGADNKQ